MKKTLIFIYENKKITKTLRIISTVSIFTSFLGFGALIYKATKESIWSLAEVLLILGLPFLAVTVLRGLINAKRPYELYDFYERKPKEKLGRSFPSRHAYSSAVISVLTLFINSFLGGVLVFFTVLLCVCRVLLGIHFVRDVLCGGIIGALAAILGFVIFTPF